MRHRLTQFISSRSSVFPGTRTWEADPRDDVRDDLRCPLGREQAAKIFFASSHLNWSSGQSKH